MQGVELANELPFRIGRYEVRPATRELLVGNDRITLEPRILQVLVVLARRSGEVVSRDELIATCWPGRTVGQEALNRCIAALRRPGTGLFEQGFEIETVPRVGYRLSPGNGPSETACEPLVPVPGNRRAWRWLLLAGGLVALLGIGFGQYWTRHADWELVSITPLVGTPVAERYPAFSADGKWVAYAAGSNARTRDIYVLRVGSPTPERFTDEPDDESGPSWSADGRWIVYTSFSNGRPCRFRMRAFPSGLAHDAGACLIDSRASAVFTPDGRALLVAERAFAGGTRRIQRLDLTTERRSMVTAPPADSLGDNSPRFSPDGRLLLVRRQLSDQSVALVVHDMLAGTDRVVVPSQLDPVSGAWLPDGSGVAFTRRENATSSLWTVPVTGGTPRRVAILASRAGEMSAGPDGRLVVEIDQSRVDVAWAIGRSSDPPTYLSPMNGRTYTPAFAPDGTLAVASNRSGTWAIWIMPPGGSARPLISYEISETLRWSPDGQRLTFATSANGVVTLHTVDRQGREGPKTTVPFRATATVAWSGDGTRLIFPGLDASGWRIYAVQPGDPSSVRPISSYGFWDVEVRGSAIYALKADQTGIWRIDAQPHAEWSERPNTELAGWRLIGDDLVWIDFAAPPQRRLLARSLAGGPTRVVAATPDMADFGQFDRDPRSGRYVYVRAATVDRDLLMLQIRQLRLGTE